jgi:hypothetical protein
MKKFMLIAAAGLLLVACNTEKKDTTTATEDSTAIEAPVVAESDVLNYESTDGKQHFEVSFMDEARDSMKLVNVEESVFYLMKHAVSADGAKWEDENGNYFWTKGEEFYFGQGDKQLCEGHLVSAPAEEPAAE